MSTIFDQMTETSPEAGALEQPANIENEPVSTEADSDIQIKVERQTAHAGPIYTQRQIKEISQELLRYGLIEANRKPQIYQSALTYRETLNRIFEPLDLRIKIDDVRGLAFLLIDETFAQNSHDEWTHPLIRKQRLTLEQSLLLAILREFYVKHELENGIGNNQALLPIAELLPQLRVYLGELGSEIAEDKRLRQLLEKLKAQGVVSEVDKYEQVRIRPIITHLANPENLSSLLLVLQQKAAAAQGAESQEMPET